MIPVDSNADALEQKYKDLSGLLSNIVDSVPMYFFVKDTGDDFRYVYSSPMMNQIYGRFHNDVVGKTDFDLLTLLQRSLSGIWMRRYFKRKRCNALLNRCSTPKV